MIYQLFTSIRHHKFRTGLVLVLAFISYALILLTLTNGFAFNTQVRSVKEMFASPENTYRIDISHIEDFDSSGQALAELKDFANQYGNSIGAAYDQSGEYFDELLQNSDFISLNESAYAGTLRENTPEVVEVVFFDPEILELMNTDFTQDDFAPISNGSGEYLPLYVGQEYAEILSINDTLTLSRNGAKYIVKGYLQDEVWFDDSDCITMPLTSLDHKFLAPFSVQDRTDSITQQSTAGKILIYAGENNSDLISDLSNLALDLGIKLRITGITDYIKSWTTDNNEVLKLNYFLAAIVTLCSAISMCSALCVTVLLNKREYGVRIAYGNTIREIGTSLGIEFILLNIIAAVTAFFVVLSNFQSTSISSFRSIYIETLCTTSLIGLVALILLLSAIVLFLPLNILSRYKPVELVKEED